VWVADLSRFEINRLEMVDQIVTSSNRLMGWLRRVEALRTVGS
jgi:hypothetical protein